MSIDNVFDDVEVEDIYKLKKVGSFGRFSTVNNFPIEFFLTTLKSSQLDTLTFARDIKPASIDFEQLLQRDIDEERVKSEIEPYLTSPGLTDVEKKSKTIFFPPLLVAAMPVENKTMQSHYSEQTVISEDGFLYREWSDHFKLKLRRTKNGYTIQPSMLKDDKYSISPEPAIFEANISNGIERGINLVVIDGQHRLKALIDVYNDNTIDLSELSVPICILFSPNSTIVAADKLNNEIFTIPSTSQIFRQLFVDVNKNAIQVGGHFNILLSEGNMGSAICRGLCKSVLVRGELESLAQIEWNQKNKKLSTEINRNYYLTSVGVIEKALSETFSKNKAVFNYLIDFKSIDSIVHPINVDDHHEYPTVSWERFSLSQKNAIESQLSINLIPTLEKLFFETKLFKPAVECFKTVLNQFRGLANSDPKGLTQYQPVIDLIVEYIPIGSDNVMKIANSNYRKFEDDISQCKDKIVFPLIGHAIFQRAIFLVFLEITKACKVAKVDANVACDIFITFINEMTAFLGDTISSKRSYCQSYIYTSNKINPTGDVRKGLAYLMLSNLSSLKFRGSIINKFFRVEENSRVANILSDELENIGYRSVNSYFELYIKNKTREFKSSYITDRSLSPEERQELYDLEAMARRDEKAFKDGEIAKKDISSEFEELVSKYVSVEADKSKDELRTILNLELDIFGLSGLFSEDSVISSSFED
jgi:hypothetical protein